MFEKVTPSPGFRKYKERGKCPAAPSLPLVSTLRRGLLSPKMITQITETPPQPLSTGERPHALSALAFSVGAEEAHLSPTLCEVPSWASPASSQRTPLPDPCARSHRGLPRPPPSTRSVAANRGRVQNYPNPFARCVFPSAWHRPENVAALFSVPLDMDVRSACAEVVLCVSLLLSRRAVSFSRNSRRGARRCLNAAADLSAPLSPPQPAVKATFKTQNSAALPTSVSFGEGLLFLLVMFTRNVYYFCKLRNKYF